MGNLLEQAQRMQKSLEDARTALREARIVGQAGGGAVRATVDGKMRVVMLGELVLAALNDAQSRAKRDHDERMAKVTGGLNLPGLL